MRGCVIGIYAVFTGLWFPVSKFPTFQGILPEDFFNEVSRIDYSSATTKINGMLGNFPVFCMIKSVSDESVGRWRKLQDAAGIDLWIAAIWASTLWCGFWFLLPPKKRYFCNFQTRWLLQHSGSESDSRFPGWPVWEAEPSGTSASRHCAPQLWEQWAHSSGISRSSQWQTIFQVRGKLWFLVQFDRGSNGFDWMTGVARIFLEGRSFKDQSTEHWPNFWEATDPSNYSPGNHIRKAMLWNFVDPRNENQIAGQW